MGYHSDSIAISRDMGPLSWLFCDPNQMAYDKLWTQMSGNWNKRQSQRLANHDFCTPKQSKSVRLSRNRGGHRKVLQQEDPYFSMSVSTSNKTMDSMKRNLSNNHNAQNRCKPWKMRKDCATNIRRIIQTGPRQSTRRVTRQASLRMATTEEATRTKSNFDLTSQQAPNGITIKEKCHAHLFPRTSSAMLKWMEACKISQIMQ